MSKACAFTAAASGLKPISSSTLAFTASSLASSGIGAVGESSKRSGAFGSTVSVSPTNSVGPSFNA